MTQATSDALDSTVERLWINIIVLERAVNVDEQYVSTMVLKASTAVNRAT